MNFLIVFGFSLLITALLVYLTRKLNLVYKPQEDRWNTRVVSLHGGVAIWLTFVTAITMTGTVPLTEKWIAILIGSSGMMLLGLYDDIYTVTPRVKLWSQTILTTLALCSGVMFIFSESFIVNAFLAFYG